MEQIKLIDTSDLISLSNMLSHDVVYEKKPRDTSSLLQMDQVEVDRQCASKPLNLRDVESVSNDKKFSKTSTPGAFLKEWMKKEEAQNSLIILDLDDTVICPPKDCLLGQSQTFYVLRNCIVEAKRQSEDEASKYIHQLCAKAAQSVPVLLTDIEIPEAIQLLHQSNAMTMGFTARTNEMKDMTAQALKDNKVWFNSKLKDAQMETTKGSYGINNGTVFVGMARTKGDVLVELLKNEALQKSTKIMLIDDREEHLLSTRQALSTWDKSIQFIPVLCTYPKEHLNHLVFNYETIMSALFKFVSQNRHCADVSKLINTDPFTKDVIVWGFMNNQT